ncbi:response regulator [Rhodococcus sp. P1Y]|uniref:response regulator n=1 Tax=Rhodococcus sp. P1Y TaxID=1302308 RepID=UPI000EAFBB63|nr:response regulator transcription factor [Rhodococcus sp. P1Y]AYJ47534.1 DNA-binding response regulator [Rhodococcus sp. P1Y]
MITVLLVDDQPVVRQGFEMFLSDDPRIRVVGHAASGSTAVEQVAALRPDVVLMDVRMPGRDGLSATRDIVERFPESRVIVVTTFDLDEYVFAALDFGAAGFLLKDADPGELVAAVLTVSEGGTAIADRVTTRVAREFARRRTTPTKAVEHDLTAREMDVVQKLANGKSNEDIAAELYIEPSTVKTHIGNIARRLGVRTRVQIVIWAYRSGVV